MKKREKNPELDFNVPESHDTYPTILTRLGMSEQLDSVLSGKLS
jgi:hypothetical protein